MPWRPQQGSKDAQVLGAVVPEFKKLQSPVPVLLITFCGSCFPVGLQVPLVLLRRRWLLPLPLLLLLLLCCCSATVLL